MEITDVIGTTRVRDCCVFLWRQGSGEQSRLVFVRPYHCAACVRELHEVAKVQRISVAQSVHVDFVADFFQRERTGLLLAWDRQAQAAAAAGAPLDPLASRILPAFIDSLQAALAGREAAKEVPAFRRLLSALGTLGGFVEDAALAELPDMGNRAHRELLAAIARAALTTVLTSPELSAAAVQRERARVARLAHELRNTLTATQLAFDLVARQLSSVSPAAERLRRRLRDLRETVEGGLLEDLLASGVVRRQALPLAPLLNEAARACADAVRRRSLQLLIEPAQPLTLRGDPLLLAPAVRSLVLAAVEVSGAGAVVRLRGTRRRDRAHLSVMTDKPRRSRPELPRLALVRRTARAHGGALTARRIPSDGAVFTLDLPAH